MPGFFHGPGHAGDVGAPFGTALGLEVVERDLTSRIESDRMGANHAVRAAGKRHPDMAVNRHGQHPAVVVVGVLTDEVDTTRSRRDPKVVGGSEQVAEGGPEGRRSQARENQKSRLSCIMRRRGQM